MASFGDDAPIGYNDVTDALSVLSDLLDWRLPPARWAEIEEILDSLGIGFDLADQDQRGALRSATIELELAGPVRTSRIETGTPPPGRVRERVNELKHVLSMPADLATSRETDGDDDPDARSGTR